MTELGENFELTASSWVETTSPEKEEADEVRWKTSLIVLIGNPDFRVILDRLVLQRERAIEEMSSLDLQRGTPQSDYTPEMINERIQYLRYGIGIYTDLLKQIKRDSQPEPYRKTPSSK